MELTKQLPHNLEIESSILASCLVDQEFDLWDGLKHEYFYHKRNQKVYEAIQKLRKRGEPVDAGLIGAELKSDRDLVGHINTILDAPISVNHPAHIAALRKLWQLRQMFIVANAVTKRVLSSTPDQADDVAAFIAAEMDRIGAGQSGGWVHVKDILLDCLETAEELNQRKGITGVPSGFMDVDHFTCGFQPGDLVILAARPGMGKTAFGCNVLANSAGCGFCGGLISLEMVRGQVGNRFLAMRAMVDALKFRSGRFTGEDWDKMSAAAETISRYGIWVDDSPRASYQDCEKKLRDLVRVHGGRIAVIDYLGFMDGDKDTNKVNEIQSITRALKAQAKEFGIPIILIAQLSRECEKRPNKRPILSDLRDSGAIEQDADVVLFLYRDDYYKAESKEPGIVEVSIAKQRNGPTGTIKLKWLDKYTKFANLERVV